MIKRAMISGVNSTGVNVADLRVLPAAVARHLLKSHGYDAGFHVGPAAAIGGPEDPVLRASRHRSVGLVPEGDREALQPPGTAPRGRGRRGAISYPARAREGYADDLLANLDKDAIRRRAFRIVVDYGYSAASFVLPLVLGPLGVEAVAAHAFTPDLPPGRRRRCGGSSARRNASSEPLEPIWGSYSTAPPSAST